MLICLDMKQKLIRMRVMKIIIKDRKFGQENYECNVYIDGEKQDTSGGRNKEINCEKACEVKIEYINKILNKEIELVKGIFKNYGIEKGDVVK